MSRNLARTLPPRPPGNTKHSRASSRTLAGRSDWLGRARLGVDGLRALPRTRAGGTS